MAQRASAVFPGLALVVLFANCLLIDNTEAGCFLERGVTTPNEGHDAYTCLRSQDFHKDLERLPINATKHVNVSFRESKVTKIDKDSLKKLGVKALGISVVHCGLTDIDDHAFNGLTELKALILRRNKLTSVKKEWFKDLGKLESLDLSGNEIREFDPSIFEMTPMIQEFEISENQLTRFDVEGMKTKWPKLKKVGLQSNPYEWSQGVKIIEYSNQHPSVVKNSYTSIDGIRDTYKLVLECQSTIVKKDDHKEMDNCVKTKLAKAVESPKMLEGEKPVEPAKTT